MIIDTVLSIEMENNSQTIILFQKIPILGKKLYLYALVSEQTALRKYKTAQFDVRVAVENGSKFLEICHEEMKRTNISYFKNFHF